MDRDELARVIEEAETAAGCFTVPAVRLAVADAALSWFREYLGREETVETMAKAHCDYFGGEGWWETGLLADTLPEGRKAMRAALTSIAGK